MNNNQKIDLSKLQKCIIRQVKSFHILTLLKTGW